MVIFSVNKIWTYFLCFECNEWHKNTDCIIGLNICSESIESLSYKHFLTVVFISRVLCLIKPSMINAILFLMWKNCSAWNGLSHQMNHPTIQQNQTNIGIQIQSLRSLVQQIILPNPSLKVLNPLKSVRNSNPPNLLHLPQTLFS